MGPSDDEGEEGRAGEAGEEEARGGELRAEGGRWAPTTTRVRREARERRGRRRGEAASREGREVGLGNNEREEEGGRGMASSCSLAGEEPKADVARARGG